MKKMTVEELEEYLLTEDIDNPKEFISKVSSFSPDSFRTLLLKHRMRPFLKERKNGKQYFNFTKKVCYYKSESEENLIPLDLDMIIQYYEFNEIESKLYTLLFNGGKEKTLKNHFVRDYVKFDS
jgi:hypothetical protein